MRGTAWVLAAGGLALAWAVASAAPGGAGWEDMLGGEPGTRWERWRCEDGDFGIDPRAECGHHATGKTESIKAAQAAQQYESGQLALGILWVTGQVRTALAIVGVAALMTVLGRALFEGKVSPGRFTGILAAVAFMGLAGALVGFLAGGESAGDAEAQIRGSAGATGRATIDWEDW